MPEISTQNKDVAKTEAVKDAAQNLSESQEQNDLKEAKFSVSPFASGSSTSTADSKEDKSQRNNSAEETKEQIQIASANAGINNRSTVIRKGTDSRRISETQGAADQSGATQPTKKKKSTSANVEDSLFQILVTTLGPDMAEKAMVAIQKLSQQKDGVAGITGQQAAQVLKDITKILAGKESIEKLFLAAKGKEKEGLLDLGSIAEIKEYLGSKLFKDDKEPGRDGERKGSRSILVSNGTSKESREGGTGGDKLVLSSPPDETITRKSFSEIIEEFLKKRDLLGDVAYGQYITQQTHLLGEHPVVSLLRNSGLVEQSIGRNGQLTVEQKRELSKILSSEVLAQTEQMLAQEALGIVQALIARDAADLHSSLVTEEEGLLALRREAVLLFGQVDADVLGIKTDLELQRMLLGRLGERYPGLKNKSFEECCSVITEYLEKTGDNQNDQYFALKKLGIDPYREGGDIRIYVERIDNEFFDLQSTLKKTADAEERIKATNAQLELLTQTHTEKIQQNFTQHFSPEQRTFALQVANRLSAEKQQQFKALDRQIENSFSPEEALALGQLRDSLEWSVTRLQIELALESAPPAPLQALTLIDRFIGYAESGALARTPEFTRTARALRSVVTDGLGYIACVERARKEAIEQEEIHQSNYERARDSKDPEEAELRKLFEQQRYLRETTARLIPPNSDINEAAHAFSRMLLSILRDESNAIGVDAQLQANRFITPRDPSGNSTTPRIARDETVRATEKIIYDQFSSMKRTLATFYELRRTGETPATEQEQGSRNLSFGTSVGLNSDEVKNALALVISVSEQTEPYIPSTEDLQSLKLHVPSESRIGRLLSHLDLNSPEKAYATLRTQCTPQEAFQVSCFLENYRTPIIFSKAFNDPAITDPKTLWEGIVRQNIGAYQHITLRTSQTISESEHSAFIQETEVAQKNAALSRIELVRTTLEKLSPREKEELLNAYLIHTGISIGEELLIIRSNVSDHDGDILSLLASFDFVTQADLAQYAEVPSEVPVTVEARQRYFEELFARDTEVNFDIDPFLQELQVIAEERARFSLAAKIAKDTNNTTIAERAQDGLRAIDAEINQKLANATGAYSEAFLVRHGIRRDIAIRTAVITTSNQQEYFNQARITAEELVELFKKKDFSQEEALLVIRSANFTQGEAILNDAMYFISVAPITFNDNERKLTGKLAEDLKSFEETGPETERRIAMLVAGGEKAIFDYDLETLTIGMRTENPNLTGHAFAGMQAGATAGRVLAALRERAPEVYRKFEDAKSLATTFDKQVSLMYRSVAESDAVAAAAVRLRYGHEVVSRNASEVAKMVVEATTDAQQFAARQREAVGELIQDGRDKLKDLADPYRGVIRRANEGLQHVTSEVKEGVREVASEVREFAGETAATIGSGIQQGAQATKEFSVNAVKDAYREAFGSELADDLNQKFAELKPVWDNLIKEEIPDRASAAAALVMNALIGGSDYSKDAFILLAAKLEPVAAKVGTAIQENFPEYARAFIHQGGRYASLQEYLRVSDPQLGESKIKILEQYLAGVSPELVTRELSGISQIKANIEKLEQLKALRLSQLTETQSYMMNLTVRHSAAVKNAEERWFNVAAARAIPPVYKYGMNEQSRRIDLQMAGIAELEGAIRLQLAAARLIIKDAESGIDRTERIQRAGNEFLKGTLMRDAAVDWRPADPRTMATMLRELHKAERELAVLDSWTETYIFCAKLAALTAVSFIPGVGFWAVLGIATMWNLGDKGLRYLNGSMSLREAFFAFAADLTLDVIFAGLSVLLSVAKLPILTSLRVGDKPYRWLFGRGASRAVNESLRKGGVIHVTELEKLGRSAAENLIKRGLEISKSGWTDFKAYTYHLHTKCLLPLIPFLFPGTDPKSGNDRANEAKPTNNTPATGNNGGTGSKPDPIVLNAIEPVIQLNPVQPQVQPLPAIAQPQANAVTPPPPIDIELVKKDFVDKLLEGLGWLFAKSGKGGDGGDTPPVAPPAVFVPLGGDPPGAGGAGGGNSPGAAGGGLGGPAIQIAPGNTLTGPLGDGQNGNINVPANNEPTDLAATKTGTTAPENPSELTAQADPRAAEVLAMIEDFVNPNRNFPPTIQTVVGPTFSESIPVGLQPHALEETVRVPSPKPEKVALANYDLDPIVVAASVAQGEKARLEQALTHSYASSNGINHPQQNVHENGLALNHTIGAGQQNTLSSVHLGANQSAMPLGEELRNASRQAYAQSAIMANENQMSDAKPLASAHFATSQSLTGGIAQSRSEASILDDLVRGDKQAQSSINSAQKQEQSLRQSRSLVENETHINGSVKQVKVGYDSEKSFAQNTVDSKQSAAGSRAQAEQVREAQAKSDQVKAEQVNVFAINSRPLYGTLNGSEHVDTSKVGVSSSEKIASKNNTQVEQRERSTQSVEISDQLREVYEQLQIHRAIVTALSKEDLLEKQTGEVIEASGTRRSKDSRSRKKAAADARLMQFIIAQLKTRQFLAAERDKLMALLFKLGISEIEYRKLVVEMGEIEAQRHAAGETGYENKIALELSEEEAEHADEQDSNNASVEIVKAGGSVPAIDKKRRPDLPEAPNAIQQAVISRAELFERLRKE